MQRELLLTLLLTAPILATSISDGTYVVLYRDKKFQTKKVNILMSQNNQTLIESCPTNPLAQGSEVFLSKLGVYGVVEVVD